MHGSVKWRLFRFFNVYHQPTDGDSTRKVCSVATGESHLRNLSASLKALQKEVNDSLTALVEREKEREQGSQLARQGERDSKGE